jgi:hypothetical protein
MAHEDRVEITPPGEHIFGRLQVIFGLPKPLLRVFGHKKGLLLGLPLLKYHNPAMEKRERKEAGIPFGLKGRSLAVVYVGSF